MKKILFILLSCMMLVSLSSCKSDGEDSSFSLVGKTYAAPGALSNTYTAFRFISNTQAEQTLRRNSPTGEISGEPDIIKYELNYPEISLYTLDEFVEGGILKLKGTFADDDCFRIKTRFGYTEYRLQK